MVAIFRISNLNPLSDSKQSRFNDFRPQLFYPLMNTLDKTSLIQHRRQLGYALPMRTEYEETPNLKKHRVKDCPFDGKKDRVLKRTNE